MRRDFLHETPVNPVISTEFGMESGDQVLALLNQHRIAQVGC
jgi:hypothetical protein